MSHRLTSHRWETCLSSDAERRRFFFFALSFPCGVVSIAGADSAGSGFDDFTVLRALSIGVPIGVPSRIRTDGLVLPCSTSVTWPASCFRVLEMPALSPSRYPAKSAAAIVRICTAPIMSQVADATLVVALSSPSSLSLPAPTAATSHVGTGAEGCCVVGAAIGTGVGDGFGPSEGSVVGNGEGAGDAGTGIEVGAEVRSQKSHEWSHACAYGQLGQNSSLQ